MSKDNRRCPDCGGSDGLHYGDCKYDGCLQSFSDSFNAADTETLNCYKAMKLYLEE